MLPLQKDVKTGTLAILDQTHFHALENTGLVGKVVLSPFHADLVTEGARPAVQGDTKGG
jgi:hypothetical protein